jgi:hypothetical protein
MMPAWTCRRARRAERSCRGGAGERRDIAFSDDERTSLWNKKNRAELWSLRG